MTISKHIVLLEILCWFTFISIFSGMDHVKIMIKICFCLCVWQGYFNWKEDSNFGRQRVQGCNPTLLRLCTEIPEK